MAQLLTIRLTRTDSTQSWGFRLQGGKDFGTPLLVQKVNAGSLAEKAGLRVADALMKVNNVEVGEMRHKDAQDVIIGAGNAVTVTVQRGGHVTWRPSVSPVGSIPSPNSHISVSPVPVTKTSLAATYKPGCRPPHGFNSASKPFSPQLNGGGGHEGENGAIKAIVNKQYNSPVGIYSDESIAETLSAQAEVLAGGVLGVNFKKNEKNYNAEGSEVFKMLREAEHETKWPEPAVDESRPDSHEPSVAGLRSVSAPRPKSPSSDNSSLAPGKNICADCERLIVGVFVRIKGKNLHVECFKCATCGTSLKNVGYYSINEKLYCDIHAKMVARQNPPAPNLEPVTEPPHSRPSDRAPWKSSPTSSRFNTPSSPAPVNSFASPSPHLTSTNGDSLYANNQHSGNSSFSTTSASSNNVESFKTEARTVVEKTLSSSSSMCRVYATNVSTATTSIYPSQRLPFLRPRNDDNCKPKQPSNCEKKISRNLLVETNVNTTATRETINSDNRKLLNEDTGKQISTCVKAGRNPLIRQEHKVQSFSEPPLTAEDKAEGQNKEGVIEGISTASATTKSPSTSEQKAASTPAAVEYAESDIEDRAKLQSACSREIARILSDSGGCESSDDLDGEEYAGEVKYEVREEDTCDWRNVAKDKRVAEIGTPHGVRPLSPYQPTPRHDQIVVFPPPAPSFYPQSGALRSASPACSQSSYEVLETCAIRSKNMAHMCKYNTCSESRNEDDTENVNNRPVLNTSVSNDNNEGVTTSRVIHSPVHVSSNRYAEISEQATTEESRASTPASLSDAPLRGGTFATALTIAPERPYTPLQASTAATICTENPSLPEPCECYMPTSEKDDSAISHSPNGDENELRRPRLADALATIGCYASQTTNTPTTDDGAPTLPSLDDDPSAILRQPASSVAETRDSKKVDDGRLSRNSLRQELEMKIDEKRAIWRAERRPRTVEYETPSAQSSRLTSPAFGARRPTPTNFEATVTTCNKVYGPETQTRTTHCASLTRTRTTRSQSRSPLPSPSLAKQGSASTGDFQEHTTECSTTLVVTSVRELTTTPVAQSTVTTICEQQRQQEEQREPTMQRQQQQREQPPSRIEKAPRLAQPRSPQPSPRQLQRRLSSVAEERGVGGGADRLASRDAAASLLARRLGSLSCGSSATNPSACPSPACASSTASADTIHRATKTASVGADLGSGGAKAPGAYPNAPPASASSAGRSAPRRGKGVWNPQNKAPGARIPLCAHCSAQIRGPFVTALGKIWCPEHFLCVNDKCGRSLLDIGFVEEPTGLYCEYCFERYLAPTCAKCLSKIKADCLNAIGKHFHPNCFTCAYCGRLFGNDPFFLEDGLPYCENDWNELFTTKCFSCGFPIEAGDRWVEALDNNYHSPCFNCTICKTNLEGQSFYAKAGRPYCKQHSR